LIEASDTICQSETSRGNSVRPTQHLLKYGESGKGN
jgi:hypothetical protein